MSEAQETQPMPVEQAEIGDIYSRNERLYLVKDQAIGAGEMDNLKMVTLCDGDPKLLCCESDRMEEAGFVNVNDLLNPREWNHLASYRLHGGSEEEINQAIDAYMSNAVAISARGCVPFELMGADRVGNIKEVNTALKDAMGYWKRAVAWLEVEHSDDENEEPMLIVRMSFHGVLFNNRLENALGEKLDEIEDLGNLVAVVPMFYTPDSEFNPHGTAIDFDITMIGDHVSDEEEATVEEDGSLDEEE